MRVLCICSLLTSLVALPADAQKINVDYDNATAFGDYTTFQFRETSHDLRRASPSLHDAVVSQLTDFALDGELLATRTDPDVYIAYYAAYVGDLRLVTNDLEYAYGAAFTPGSYWSGAVGTQDFANRSFTFDEGTVVVDVWDRDRQLLVWRGIATEAFNRDYNRNEAKLSKALAKLRKQWKKMHGDTERTTRKLEAE